MRGAPGTCNMMALGIWVMTYALFGSSIDSKPSLQLDCQDWPRPAIQTGSFTEQKRIVSTSCWSHWISPDSPWSFCLQSPSWGQASAPNEARIFNRWVSNNRSEKRDKHNDQFRTWNSHYAPAIHYASQDVLMCLSLGMSCEKLSNQAHHTFSTTEQLLQNKILVKEKTKNDLIKQIKTIE